MEQKRDRIPLVLVRVTDRLVCLGRRGFPECGAFKAKTRKVLHKPEGVGHPRPSAATLVAGFVKGKLEKLDLTKLKTFAFVNASVKSMRR